jgi:hypothetical protein
MLRLLLRTEHRAAPVASVVALVDSGAQETLLPLVIAEELGFREGEMNEDPGSAQGVGSRFAKWRTSLAVYGHVLRPRMRDLKLPWGPELRLRPVFAEVPIALLGRADFFPHFRITFETDAVGAIFHLDAA